MMEEMGFARKRTASHAEGLLSVDPQLVYASLSSAGVAGLYPGFRRWFFGLVVPGLYSGERRIILSKANGILTGIAICKRNQAERKLCTLWVSPSARERRVASALASQAFDWLDSDRPLFTVPEERISEFEGLCKAWHFSAPTFSANLYREGRVEYVFNGAIKVSAN